MSKLLIVNYDKVVKVLSSIGYVVSHQKGSHIVLRFTDTQKYFLRFGYRKNATMLVVPAHKPLGKGMLRVIIREIDLSVEEFNKLYEKI